MLWLLSLLSMCQHSVVCEEKVRAFALTAIAENRKPEEVGGVAKVIEVNRSAVEAG